MSSSQKAPSAVASRYAGALVELAAESQAETVVARDLSELQTLLESSADFRLFIGSPVLGAPAQLGMIKTLAEKGKLHHLTAGLLHTLVKNRRLNALGAVIAAAQQGFAARRGEITVDVTTAQDMSAAQQAALRAALEKGLSRKVQIRAKVEPSIMGGIIVTAGSTMVDDSVRAKLARLKTAMTRQANQNPQGSGESRQTA